MAASNYYDIIMRSQILKINMRQAEKLIWRIGTTLPATPLIQGIDSRSTGNLRDVRQDRRVKQMLQ